MLDAYDRIVVALTDDKTADVSEAATVIAKDAPNDPIRTAARPLVGTDKDIVQTREDFKELSSAITAYVAANREALEASVTADSMPRTAYCPMAEAVWLQHGDKITNPYFGKSMLRCGEFQEEAGVQRRQGEQ